MCLVSHTEHGASLHRLDLSAEPLPPSLEWDRSPSGAGLVPRAWRPRRRAIRRPRLECLDHPLDAPTRVQSTPMHRR